MKWFHRNRSLPRISFPSALHSRSTKSYYRRTSPKSKPAVAPKMQKRSQPEPVVSSNFHFARRKYLNKITGHSLLELLDRESFSKTPSGDESFKFGSSLNRDSRKGDYLNCFLTIIDSSSILCNHQRAV